MLRELGKGIKTGMEQSALHLEGIRPPWEWRRTSGRKPVERCARSETGWEGQPRNVQGPVQNENMGCVFEKWEESVI